MPSSMFAIPALPELLDRGTAIKAKLLSVN
jgi:hypothetical protein